MPTNGIDTRMGHEALAYATRGVLIFPLWHTVGGLCQCGDGPGCGSPGKHPRTPKGLENWGASSGEARVIAWWMRWPHANIGMPAGANGLAVIDVDADHDGYETLAVLDQYCLERGVDPAATRTIRTGGGGEHRIYWQPPGGIPSKRQAFGDDAPGVDTRGRGGYIVAPPSLHASGQRYEVIHNGHTIAPWPAPLTELLEQAETGPPAPAPLPALDLRPLTGKTREQRWAAHGLMAECERLAALPLAGGNGKNDALNGAALKMGRRVVNGWISEVEVTEALYQAASAWIGHGHTDRSIRATIRSGLAAGIRNPHPGPTTRGVAS